MNNVKVYNSPFHIGSLEPTNAIRRLKKITINRIYQVKNLIG